MLTGCGTIVPASSSPTVAKDGKTVLTESDAGKTFPFSAGASFRIELAGNRTTGYSWQLARNDDGVLEAMPSSYIEDPHAPGMMGVGGTEIFPFKASKKGTTTVRLTYRRPWKGGDVSHQVEFKIIVH